MYSDRNERSECSNKREQVGMNRVFNLAISAMEFLRRVTMLSIFDFSNSYRLMK